MPQHNRPDTLPAGDKALRSAIIADLARPPRIANYDEGTVTLVVAIRLMAISLQVQSDPVVELSRHLHSLAAAKAVLDLAQACSGAWPQNVMVNRPCCPELSPDESVFADMAGAVLAGNRGRFHAVLDGLIRRERQGRLYGLMAVAMAELSDAAS